MSEEKKSFTISDRRHFQADGATREADPETAQASRESSLRANSEDHRTDAEAPGQAHGGGPIEFSHFLLSLAAQAGLLLQPMKSDSEGRSEEDVEGVRQIISILEMLQDKTEGRRTLEENRLLDQILYELRMAYLATRREGGA